MNKESEPIRYIIDLCESNELVSQFDISNAKDELYRVYKENEQLKQQIKDFDILLRNPIGWGRINTYNDLYSFSNHYNPHLDPNTVVPLYTDKESFTKWLNSRNKSPYS